MRYRWQALEIVDNRQGVGLRQGSISMPRHDRRQYPPGGRLSRCQRGHDLLVSPATQSGLLIRRQVRPDENPQSGNCETDIRSPEKSRHVRLAKEAARRVAIRAAAKGDEIFSTGYCRTGGTYRRALLHGSERAMIHGGTSGVEWSPERRAYDNCESSLCEVTQFHKNPPH